MSETLLTIRGIESRPVDAALKLGGDGRFRNVPPQFGYWTRQDGLDEIRKAV